MTARAASAIFALVSAFAVAPASAQESSHDVLRQLLPGEATPARVAMAASPASPAGAFDRSEVVRQLADPSRTRSLGPAVPRIVLGPGREDETLRQLSGFAAFRTELAFEPNSDVLTPDAIARLDVIGQALGDPALARATMVIGVETGADGSDAFNSSVATLRARAVVEQLASRRRIPRDRLVAVGLGRAAAEEPAREAGDRIRVVNIGATQVEMLGAGSPAARTAAAPAEPPSGPALSAARLPRTAKPIVAAKPRAKRDAVALRRDDRPVMARRRPVDEDDDFGPMADADMPPWSAPFAPAVRRSGTFADVPPMGMAAAPRAPAMDAPIIGANNSGPRGQSFAGPGRRGGGWH